jgi:hypothetical protein
MIGWGDILSAEQIQNLVQLIRQFKKEQPEITPTLPAKPAVPSFANDVLPILNQSCIMCHGTLGGWDATSYESVMKSGDHAPVVIAGDIESSLLAQKLLGTQKEGTIMPPGGKLSQQLIQIILDWINAGAPNN